MLYWHVHIKGMTRTAHTTTQNNTTKHNNGATYF